jgi:hypothetical protein
MVDNRDWMEIKLPFFGSSKAGGRYAITALVLMLLVRTLAVAVLIAAGATSLPVRMLIP